MAMRNAERILLLTLWCGVGGFILLLTAAAWPNYWEYVASETAPLAWLESLLLALTATVAGLIGFIESVRPSPSRPLARGWLIVAAAFAWLAMDERFAVHERIRDHFLKPTGIKLLPWMEAGDWIILLYMIVGLAAVWGIWRLLGESRVARVFFVVALAIAAVAVGMDTLDIRSMDKSSERLLQSIEEILETIAMTSFLSAYLCVWMGRIRSLMV